MAARINTEDQYIGLARGFAHARFYLNERSRSRERGGTDASMREPRGERSRLYPNRVSPAINEL